MSFISFAYGQTSPPKGQEDQLPRRILEYVSFDGSDSSYRQALRLLLLVLNVAIEVAIPFIWGWTAFYNQLHYMTNWTLVTTILFLLIQLVAETSASSNRNSQAHFLAFIHITFECAVVFNMVVVLTYWGIIHSGEVHKY